MTVQYYTLIGANNYSCHDENFDWTPYLPKGKKPGKWTPEIQGAVVRKKGYRVTKYWNMWYEEGCRIFECEVGGIIVAEDSASSIAGVVDMEACTRIRLCKEIIPQFDSDCNTGNYNKGQYNTGDLNTGYYNTGYCNIGDRNTGEYNMGNRNTGDYNTGNRNAGNHNTGHYNTGYCNTGHRNAGHHNTGHSNTGDYNTGDYNTCNRSSGFFNTVNDSINVFNKPCNIGVWERARKPYFISIVGIYKESWRKAYDGASKEDKLLLVKLPNFDADVFYEISGIMVDPKTGKEKQ